VCQRPHPPTQMIELGALGDAQVQWRTAFGRYHYPSDAERYHLIAKDACLSIHDGGYEGAVDVLLSDGDSRLGAVTTCTLAADSIRRWRKSAVPGVSPTIRTFEFERPCILGTPGATVALPQSG
jgi:hypothetical protein